MMGALTETLHIPCTLEATHDLRRMIRGLCERAGLNREWTDDLLLAVTEATTNAILYGCPMGGNIELRWKNDEACTEIEVEDNGVFRKRIPMPELDESRGRGIPLMLALMDEVHIQQGTRREPGTVVRLVKCSPR